MNMNVGRNAALFGLTINNTSGTNTEELFTTEQLTKLKGYPDEFILNIHDTTAGGNATNYLINRKYKVTGQFQGSNGVTNVGTVGLLELFNKAVLAMSNLQVMSNKRNAQ